MTIFERVYTALQTLDLPVGMGVLLTAGGPLPAEYLVYQLIDGVGTQHADDEEKEREYRIQVTFFSTTGLANLPDIDGAMAEAGGVKGSETELERNPDTGHYGLAVDYMFQAIAEPEGS